MSRFALVTGSRGAIGSAICERLEKAGYTVIGTDLGPPPPLVTRPWVSADLYELTSANDSLREFLRAVHEITQNAALHALVNNAATQVVGPIEMLKAEDWHRTLSINLTAPFYLIRAFLPDLELTRGSVVNVASIHATLTKPGFVAYATSKSALVGMTRALAVELGSRVRVNAILPAAIDTPMLREGFAARPELLETLASMHPVGRVGTPREVAELTNFLLSDSAEFLTGSCIGIDGGIAARLHDPA